MHKHSFFARQRVFFFRKSASHDLLDQTWQPHDPWPMLLAAYAPPGNHGSWTAGSTKDLGWALAGCASGSGGFVTPTGPLGSIPSAHMPAGGPDGMGSWKASRSTTLCVVAGEQGSPTQALVIHVHYGTEIDNVVYTVTYSTRCMGFKRRSLYQPRTCRSSFSPSYVNETRPTLVVDSDGNGQLQITLNVQKCRTLY